MSETRTKSITFATDYTTAGGRTYKAGSTHTINSPEARVLLRVGKAQLAEEKPAAATQPAPDATTGTPAADTAGDGTTAAKKGK